MSLQPGEAARDAAGDRPGREVERGGDRLVALIAREEPVEDLAAVLRRGGERLVNGQGLVQERKGLVGLCRRELLVGDRPLARARAKAIDAEPPGQLGQPRLDRRVVPQLVEVLVCPGEDFLEDVLGVGLRQAERLHRDGVHVAGEALDELPPGGLVAGAAARDELAVTQRRGHESNCDVSRDCPGTWLLRGGRWAPRPAELLRPPFRLAAVEVLLQLRDVDGEIALARGQVRLQLGPRLLALLEPLLADLELGLELRLAEVDRRLALLELLRPGREDVLALVESLLLALVAAPRREDRLLGLVQRRLAGRQLVVARLQAPLGELVDLRLARLLELAPPSRLGAVELRLPGDELRLALIDVCQLRASVVRRSLRLLRFALELLHPCRQLRGARRELQLALVELTRPRGQPLVASVRSGDLRLVLREHLLARLQLRPALLQLALCSGQLLLTLGQRVLQRAHLRFLCACRIERRRPSRSLPFHLLHARRELVRLRRELQLALVEVTRPRCQLAVVAGRRAELLLAL